MRRLFRAAALAGVAVLTLGGAAAARQDAPKKADDPAPKFDPKDVQVGPPPELAALRAAVETAAKKGENVDDVRAKLEALEKALAGRAWTRPKAVADLPPEPAPVPPQVFPPPGRRPAPPLLVAPDMNPGRRGEQPDFEAVARAQILLLQAAQLLAEDPARNRERAEVLRKQAQDMMLRALGARDGIVVPPGLFELPGVRGGNGRLGIRVERVAPGVAEDNNVPAGRGVRAAEVLPETPAAKAGVKAGDIIVEFAGQPVTDDPAAFVAQVQRARAGEKLDMAVIRDAKQVAIRGVVLAAAADDAADPRARLLRELAPIVGADGRPLVNPVPVVDPRARPAADPLGIVRPLPLVDPAARPPADAPREGGRRSSVNVEVRDGAATVTADENGVRFVIVGTTGPDGLVPTKIEVTEAGKTVEAASVDRLPEQYRERARQLLGRVRAGGGR